MYSRYISITLLVLIHFFILAGCTSAAKTSPPAASETLFPTETSNLKPSGTPVLPPVETLTQSVTQNAPDPLLALPAEDEASARLSLPDGFAIRIFAQNLQGKPRFMAFGPDNALYISLTNGGEIMRLPDLNQDGLADSNEVVISGLNQPHGLEWQGDWLYVAENDRIERFRYSSESGLFDQRELVTDNIPGGGGHYTRTLHFGPDGKLYVSVGSSCNVCVESDPRRAAILRFNPDGSIPADNPYVDNADTRMHAVWAWGLRNSVDFLWTPTGELWANMNGRDNLIDNNGLPDSLPPEVMVFPIRPGRFYGWPYCFNLLLGGNSISAPQVLDNQSNLRLPEGLDCNQAVPALFTDLAHSAPLGMSLGQDGNFPSEYQNDLFIAYHGSWNIENPESIRDCKVERIVIENGLPVRNEVFVNGWRAPGSNCGDASAYGRPADVIFGADGAMYISDDAGGRVYRVISVQR
ncbi:MAG TPA: sorbosone dehydrogenase [Anaerolineaceae bacterium]|nr:sorbosone dehydrogenase [Anaerolineaceae bacterium]